MAMLCICGVCIPYSVLWGMILLVFKQLWDFFQGRKTTSPAETASGATPSSTTKESSAKKESSYHGYLGDLQSMEQYHSLMENCAQSKSTLLLKFTAKWCKPCRALAPVFEKIVNEHQENVYAVSVDVDDFDELGAKYHAVLLPMMVALQHGEEKDRFRGKEENDLRSFITNLQTPAKK